MGSQGEELTYSVPYQSSTLFHEGILKNPKICPDLPSDALLHAHKIKFTGSDFPSIPINWRFAESIASLKALEGTLLNSLLVKKYGVPPQEIVIDTDHAQLFIMSTLLWTLDPKDAALKAGGGEKAAKQLEKFFPNYDIHRQSSTFHRISCTNIYKTKDDRFFHLHGSMNPDPSLKSIGLPTEMDAATIEDSWKPFVANVAQIDSAEIQRLATDVYKQAGTIAWTTEEYQNSEHGKANAHVGLFEIKEHADGSPAGWWPDSSSPATGPLRPLAGLKVLDITRVIAAPAIGRGLAEMGASVMRVAAPHLVDFSSLHCDLHWGKWNALLDFRKEKDREKLKALILDADVIIQGYRPGVLDKYGLGEKDVLDLVKGRGRGIIYVRENCYGWNGPWQGRSGWQQISDACCGVSMCYGLAMGNPEAVTPVFPNSDYCTGVAGISAILTALIRRADKGGSYSIDIALNYYSQWLVSSCGTYSAPVWNALWQRNGSPVFRHYHNMLYTLPRMLKIMAQNSGERVFKEEFFEDRESGVLGVDIRCVKPILGFPEGKVKLGYNVGTRGNGVDKARWPKDLGVEVVGVDN